MTELLIKQWFDQQGWTPHAFQVDAWEHIRAGRSGLLNVPTGSGKTLAALGGVLTPSRTTGSVHTVYITPIRALARDIGDALRQPCDALGLGWRVEERTGDTSSSRKSKQRDTPPEILVTTPESLAILMTYPNATTLFSSLETVILDEWHSLCANKRGVLLQLNLARLRSWRPTLATWALSATVANTTEAAIAACGVDSQPVIIDARIEREIELDLSFDGPFGYFPWSKANAITAIDRIAEHIERQRCTMVFTNSRAMAEQWYDTLSARAPQLDIGLHHGSIEKAQREDIERRLKRGQLDAVICTSSLDLGLDFDAVTSVVQVGGPKEISRAIQRAGRANHTLGKKSQLTCVPTRALETLEFAALARALESKHIEATPSPTRCHDVLYQHMSSCALARAYPPDELFAQIRTTSAYRDYPRDDFDWLLDTLCTGGKTLRAYPDYHKLELDQSGACVLRDPSTAAKHRMQIGTIVSNTSVLVKLTTPGRRKPTSLGTLSEDYASKLKPGDAFIFAGKQLEVIELLELTLKVKLASKKAKLAPVWTGDRSSLSEPLCENIRHTLARHLDQRDAHTLPLRRLLEVQRSLSTLPGPDELLVELYHDKTGDFLLVYPFEGHIIHEALGALVAKRLGDKGSATFSVFASEYGFGLSCTSDFDFAAALDLRELFSPHHLLEDAIEAINIAQMARHRFREIASITGLVTRGYPGQRKSSRQVQTSAALLFDVFTKYDPDNLFIEQARREVIERHMGTGRLARTCARLYDSTLTLREIERPTPFSLALIFGRQRAVVSTETLFDRIERMKTEWLAENLR